MNDSHRVALVTLGDPATPTGGYLYHRRMAEAAPDHGAALEFVSFPAWPFPLPLAAALSLRRSLARYDVVVLDSIAAAYAIGWPPFVGMLHQPPGGIDHGPLRLALQAALDRRAYARARRLIVASAALAEELPAHLRDRVVVVPPGRDVAVRAVPAGDLRRGRAVAFLCVGNWVERKGILDLLEAFSQLPENLATLHLVGDERLGSRYGRAVRARLGALGPRVVAHGSVARERVAGMYRASDVFVLPSTREPYGTAYGEAMIEGLPVVGWRAGNLPNLADDGVEGFVLPPGDHGGLVRALRALATDESLRRRMGRAARRRAESLPTWDETARAFFEAVLSLP